jgi:hypothetical protein
LFRLGEGLSGGLEHEEMKGGENSEGGKWAERNKREVRGQTNGTCNRARVPGEEAFASN